MATMRSRWAHGTARSFPIFLLAALGIVPASAHGGDEPKPPAAVTDGGATTTSSTAATQDGRGDQKHACIAAAEQGQSQRDDGQYRAARTSFLACAQDTCPRVIAQSCTKWLRELDESAPTVVLEAKDEQGNDLSDVRVTFDGAPFATVLDGKPIEVDSGAHVFRFERDGNVPVEQRVLLRAGERARVVGGTLRPPASSEASARADAGGAEAKTRERLLSLHHVVAGSLGLGAIAAVAIGVGFVAEAGQNSGDANALRRQLGGGSSACAASASAICQSLSDRVHAQYADQNAGTALFIGAGALAAGAIVSWLVWPTSSGGQTAGTLVPLAAGAAVQITRRF